MPKKRQKINEKDISKLYTNKKQYFKRFLAGREGKVYVNTNNKVKKGRIKLTVIEKREEFKI